MDIVFEPNGVFNEVYLYVSPLPREARPAITVNDRLPGRAYGGRSSCHRKSYSTISERARLVIASRFDLVNRSQTHTSKYVISAF